MAKTLTDLNGEAVVLDVPANVKIKGEKVMRKGVTLKQRDESTVAILTGKRGRPATVTADQIERTRAI